MFVHDSRNIMPVRPSDFVRFSLLGASFLGRSLNIDSAVAFHRSESPYRCIQLFFLNIGWRLLSFLNSLAYTS